MNDKPLDELSDQEFDRLIEGFITRPDDLVSPITFLEALQQFLREREVKVVELTAEIHGDELCFDPNAPVPVHGNEFVFSDTRFIIKLRQEQTQVVRDG
jgi:hypothetical protein